MTGLKLIGDDGELLPDALSLVTAHCHFPECSRSREQLQMVLEHERSAFWSDDPSKYHPSEFMKILSTQMSQRNGRRTACAYMALVLVDPDEHGRERSFHSSLQRVAEYLQSNPAAARAYWFGDFDVEEVTLNERKIPTDKRQIEKAFSEYKNVAHICAALAVAFDHLQPAPFFADAPERDAYLLRTIAHYEDLLNAHSYVATRADLIEVKANLPKNVMELAPLLPVA